MSQELEVEMSKTVIKRRHSIDDTQQRHGFKLGPFEVQSLTQMAGAKSYDLNYQVLEAGSIKTTVFCQKRTYDIDPVQLILVKK